MNKLLLRFLLAILLACVVGLTLHIHLLKFLEPIINKAMAGVQVAQPPYNNKIVFSAYLTEIFTTATLVVLYYWIESHLKFKSAIVKGTLFGLIILAVKEDLLRMPIMNFLIGCPLKVILLQQGQIWIANIAVGIVIALIIPTKNNSWFRS